MVLDVLYKFVNCTCHAGFFKGYYVISMYLLHPFGILQMTSSILCYVRTTLQYSTYSYINCQLMYRIISNGK